jgi:hypothetical protein
MIVLATTHLRVEVDPDRGAEIVYLGPPEGPNVLAHYDWATPLPPSQSTTYGSSSLDWHAAYRGGWQELFPNAGDECVVGDVPLPFHGEVSTARWSVTSRSATRLVARAACRLPLVLERTMELDAAAPVLRITETVTNEAAFPVPYIWGHHPAFAVDAGSHIDLPAAALHVDAAYDPPSNDLQPGAGGRWPSVPGKSGATVDLCIVPAGPVDRMCYLSDMAAGWAAVRPRGAGVGVAMAWDQEAFPCLWLWQELGGPDFPWYGRARITALEPQAAWPGDGLASAIARGQARYVAGGASASAWLTMALCDAAAGAVVGMDRDGTVQQDGHEAVKRSQNE